MNAKMHPILESGGRFLPWHSRTRFSDFEYKHWSEGFSEVQVRFIAKMKHQEL